MARTYKDRPNWKVSRKDSGHRHKRPDESKTKTRNRLREEVKKWHGI